jgi:hypothetical protein
MTLKEFALPPEELLIEQDDVDETPKPKEVLSPVEQFGQELAQKYSLRDMVGVMLAIQQKPEMRYEEPHIIDAYARTIATNRMYPHAHRMFAAEDEQSEDSTSCREMIEEALLEEQQAIIDLTHHTFQRLRTIAPTAMWESGYKIDRITTTIEPEIRDVNDKIINPLTPEEREELVVRQSAEQLALAALTNNIPVMGISLNNMDQACPDRKPDVFGGFSRFAATERLPTPNTDALSPDQVKEIKARRREAIRQEAYEFLLVTQGTLARNEALQTYGADTVVNHSKTLTEGTLFRRIQDRIPTEATS